MLLLLLLLLLFQERYKNKRLGPKEFIFNQLNDDDDIEVFVKVMFKY